MQGIFENIYKTSEWGPSSVPGTTLVSGPGSTISYNLEYITFLRNYITKHQLKTIVDIGCGTGDFLTKSIMT